MKRISVVLSIVLLLASIASADVVLDDYTGLQGHSYSAFRGIGWSAPDTMVNTTNTRGGQLIVTGMNADASSGGYDDTSDVAVMSITLKPAANNTLTGLGLVMLKDNLDRRFMFLFDDFANPTSNQWETITSTSSYRDLGQGLGTGEFDWSQVAGYWIQCWDQQGNHDPQWITSVQFDQMSLLSVRPTLSTTESNPVFGIFTVNINFPEAVTGLEESDFDVVNCTVQALSGSGDTYSIEVVPTDSGTVSVTLGADTVSILYPESNTLVMTYMLPVTFVHPGIALSVEDLEHVKARLNVEPWKTGYEDMVASPYSSLSYAMQGPFASVGRLSTENNNEWEHDMEAVHSLARMWYFTGNEAYAQKARDILIAWATTHTEFLAGEVYLSMGYECMHVFEGADILRGTWPDWTQSDTDTVKAYFENVWWDISHIAVPHPLRSANQGMAQFTAALGVAIFNDDQVKFDQCLQVFLTDAAAALGSSLPNGQIGDTGRDAHDQGQLMLMAWAAEAFWKQGVDVYSAFDNRMLAAIEYLSRYNLLVDTPFIQYGTVYDIYPEIHTFDEPYENWSI